MQRGKASLIFFGILAGAVAFIWRTSTGLPDVVASHFAASGAANGFMPRALYVPFMLGLVVVLPSVMVLLPGIGLNRPHARINLPHRDYWLAPTRRAETVRVLRDHMAYVGALLVVFLSYVHWLVVRANEVAPPSLPMPWFFAGLAVFGVAAGAWALALIWHFRRVSR